MNNVIILTSILLISCSNIPVHSDFNTKFKKNQVVNYKVPKFYELVCSGKGIINDVNFGELSGMIYDIIPSYEEQLKGCPYYLNILEEEISESKT